MTFDKVDIRDLSRCVSCGTCRSVCPIFSEVGWESANTRGRVLVIRSLLDGFEADGDTLDILNTCTTCGICAEKCPAGTNVPSLVEAARAGLVKKGIMTDTQKKLYDRVNEYGNTLNETGDRLGWLTDKTRIPEKADYVYFVGCLDSYRYTDYALKAYSVLREYGVTLLDDEYCCGSPLLRTGFDADKFIQHNIEEIKKKGAHTVITGCAGCYTTLKNDYPEGNFNVMSIPEFLAEHIDEMDLKKLDISVTYHDPCHLGRHNRVFDEPRKVIESICTLKEMKANREMSRCCGGGGGVRAGYNELSLKLAKRRLEDVPEGVDYIVTSCPLCVRNLKDAGGDIPVLDIIELLAMAMDI